MSRLIAPTTSVRLALVAFTSIALLAPCIARAADPDAATLVREMRRREAWVDSVKSLRVQTEHTARRTDEGIAIRKRELKKQFPDAELTPKEFTDLYPTERGTFELAFDERRAMWRRADEHYQVEDVRAWDGTRAIVHEQYFSGQEHFSINNTPFETVGQWMMTHLSWPRGAPHKFWFIAERDQRTEGRLGKPEDFFISGRQTIDGGVECYVLERKGDLDAILIGVHDGQLRGEIIYCLDGKLPERETVPLAIAKARGHDFKTTAEYEKWYGTLSKEQRREVTDEWYSRMKPVRRRMIEWHLYDYKDFGGGRSMPMREVVEFFATEPEPKPVLTSSRETRVTDVQIDQNLPDELFKVPFKEGVKVFDRTREPVLIYPHKKDRTPQEWIELEEQAKARDKQWKAREAAMAALVGKPAPPLPKNAKWVNGEAMTWESLKGKVVVLDFWATWCGPCQNDFPLLKRLHDQREKLSYTVIGIHAAGTGADEVTAFTRKYELKHPICIDASSSSRDRSSFGGDLFTGFQVRSIPHAVVVDADGKIAGNGSLGKMVDLAEQLAAKGR